MPLYNYFCINNDCSQRKRLTIEASEAERDNQECPKCSQKLKHVGQQMIGGYQSIASSTPEARKALLKKRSKEHYKKVVQHKKREKLNNAGINEKFH